MTTSEPAAADGAAAVPEDGDVLRVEHVSKRFGAVTALTDVNLRLAPRARCSRCSATTARASPPC